MNDLEVLIMGGGLSGVSTAYHLAKAGVKDIMLVESGKIGIGSDEMLSGSNGPRFSKIISTSYENDYETDCMAVGEDKTISFLDLSYKGTKMQIDIARQLDPAIVRQNGTILVGHGIQKKWLMQEIGYYPEKYKKSFREVSIDELVEVFGAKRTAFQSGIFMPDDAVIDPSYVKLLSQKCDSIIAEGTKITKLVEEEDGVRVYTDTAGNIKARYVVNATNGFYTDSNLRGRLKQKWSYMFSFEDPGKNTPNSWEFAQKYHYWVRQDNITHVGGSDMIFEKKHARTGRFQEQAMAKLKKWAYTKFPHLEGKKILQEHYGVFATTPDEIPIVGRFSDNSRIFYIVGCNAKGQSTLTYCASLMPGIMGYKKMTKEEQEFANLLSPIRQSIVKPIDPDYQMY